MEPPSDSLPHAVRVVLASATHAVEWWRQGGEPSVALHNLSAAVDAWKASEPPTDSVDAIVDAYYDTGAYLADPTRPGATIEPPSDSCDECGMSRGFHTELCPRRVPPIEPPIHTALDAVLAMYEAALDVVATWTDPLDDDAHGTAVAELVVALERVGVLPP